MCRMLFQTRQSSKAFASPIVGVRLIRSELHVMSHAGDRNLRFSIDRGGTFTDLYAEVGMPDRNRSATLFQYY